MLRIRPPLGALVSPANLLPGQPAQAAAAQGMPTIAKVGVTAALIGIAAVVAQKMKKGRS